MKEAYPLLLVQNGVSPMKPILLAFGVVLAFSGSPTLAADPLFRAGAATVDITPTKLPSIIAGGFLEGKGTSIHDRLYVRAIVIESGTKKIAFAIVDTCMMAQPLIDDAKSIAADRCGIPVDHQMVSATHTHSAPAAMGCLGTRQDRDYAAWLPGKIAEAIVAANAKLQAARIGWSSVDDWHHTHNRRWIRKPESKIVDPFGNATGLAHMHPGYQSKDVIGPSGPVDPQLSVISIQSKEGKPLAVLANYSQHYFGAPAISSDYYGLFCKYVAKSLGQEGDGNGPFVAAMSQGTSGDQMWMDYGSPQSKLTLDTYAQAVARSAEAAIKKVKYHDSVPIGIVEKTLKLAYRVPDEKRLAWAKPLAAKVVGDLPKNQPEVYAKEALILHERQTTSLKLQAIRIGELSIATLPNEVYAITGLKLRAWSPFEQHFNIELANGAEGYIPPPEQHVLGGYTTWPARTAGLEVQAETRIVSTLLKAIEEVGGRPLRVAKPDLAPYAKAILDAKPVGYWRLNDIAGNSAVSSFESGPRAKLTPGFAWYLPGVATGTGTGAGEALTTSAFSTTRHYNRAVHLAGGTIEPEGLALGDRYSVALWFWLGEPSGASDRKGTLIDGPGGESIVAAQSKDHRVVLHLGDSSSKRELKANDWHQVVLVRDGDKLRLLVDGRPERIATLKTGEPAPLVIGRGLQGKIDELAVFDRALTDAEVVAFWRASGVNAAAMPVEVSDVSKATGRVSLEALLDGRRSNGAWKRLFNGKDLDGFHTHLKGQGTSDSERVFQVSDGAIHIYKDTPAGKSMPFGGVITDQDYRDYHLRFEFRWGTKKFAPRNEGVRDSGLLFHVFGADGGFGGTWSTSVECQVQEHDLGDLWLVGTRASAPGAVNAANFPVSRPGGTAVLTVGDRGKIARVIKAQDAETSGWNTVEVVARRDGAAFFVNGELVHYLFDIRQPDPAAADGWKPLTSGRLWFQAEGAEVLYRNIEIKSLPPLK